MGHIFISYSRKDSACVDLVTTHLEAQDFPLWRDTSKIELSANWAAAILDALDHANMYLLFWSANAQASKFVQKELEMAQARYFSSSIRYVVTILLDDTQLPTWLSHLQAEDFRSGCDGVAVAGLARRLPEELRVFNPHKALRDQVHSLVAETPLVAVLLHKQAVDNKRPLRASIVSSPGAVITKPVRELHICLQFTGAANQNMLLPVYQTFKRADVVLLHIQGPLLADGSRYDLNNKDEALWAAAHKFIVDSIAAFATPETTRLSFFAQAPAALMGRLGLSYWRFWEIDFYNYAPAADEPPYKRVYHIPRNSM